MIRILHIVPQVPPAVCGIGDYAWLLAQALRDDHDIHSSFLSAGTNWTQPEGETEFPVCRLPDFTTQALVNFVAARPGEFDAIVLHMSSYGYQKRGVPMWLALGWRQLSQFNPRPHLITMFHELFASGSASSSAFWLKPLQQHVLRIIARASDGLRTNREAYAKWLQLTVKDKKAEIPALPVFSNIGESALEADSLERWSGMTVFASTMQAKHESLLAELCRNVGIKRLGWIGDRAPPLMDPALRVRHLSHLPVQHASAWFDEYGFAFTAYNPEFLAKSGIFAAYAAYRMTVVLPEASAELPDRLGRDREFMSASELLHGESLLVHAVKIADGLHQWYLTHNLASTATSYAEQISI